MQLHSGSETIDSFLDHLSLKNARLILIFLLLAGVVALSVIVYKGENKKRAYKEDLIELSKVKYGLFNVDEWKAILEMIISEKINEFNFNELPREEIRKKVSNLLYKITGDLHTSFKEEKGFIPKTVANITGIFDKIDKEVPTFTDRIMEFIEDPRNRESIRLFALKKLDELTDRTFAEVDYGVYDTVLEKYNCEDREYVIADLHAAIEENKQHYHPYRIALFILAFVAAFMLITGRNFSKHEIFLLTLMCLAFLATGLSLPMIEIDARISEMRFSLLGEEIFFRDQILYYKNKSILEVVQVMIEQERPDLIAVGFLVLLFSVIFPLSKLITSTFYLYMSKIRNNSFVKFIIFRTGKWSMADVMVVAIFMAFIGFSGIVREQLQQLETTSPNLDLFTTNASHLQIGFFTFMTFAIMSLLVSHKLQYSFKSSKKEVLEEQMEKVEEAEA